MYSRMFLSNGINSTPVIRYTKSRLGILATSFLSVIITMKIWLSILIIPTIPCVGYCMPPSSSPGYFSVRMIRYVLLTSSVYHTSLFFNHEYVISHLHVLVVHSRA